MARLIILADDLTGAADTAACFARAGWRTVVGLSLPEEPLADFIEVLSLSTDSRQVEADEAARRVRQAVDWLRQNGLTSPGTFFYKKVDSLMRGHPAVELAAMLEALGLDRALIAPAFPAQGRRTLNGKQVVGAGSQARQIDLGEVFGRSPARLHWLGLEQARRGWTGSQPGWYLADAENESDLEGLGRAALAQDFHLACGSAGLGRALQRVAFPAQAERPPARPAKSNRPVLVVAGSRAAALERQVEAARRSGIQVVTPGEAFLKDDDFQPEAMAQVVAETLGGGQPAILTTAGLPLSPLGEAAVAERLASLAGALVEAGRVGGLVLTGGDTAAAVCRRLGARMIELYGEPVPGIAAGALLDGPQAGLPVITKAGAFECELKLLIEEFRL